MKIKNILLAIMVVICTSIFSQIGIGTDVPATCAELDISSTTKGFLPPRMTTAQRNSISTPIAGLTIYNLTNSTFEVYNGTSWYSSVHYIGESYGGGKVFHVYDNGQHGLIAATSDQNSGIRWYGGSNTNVCARGSGVGAGIKNTAIIIANQGPVDGNTFAARICNELSITVAGVIYGDWYLPSKDELALMYLYKSDIGGFSANTWYWSSTEYDDLTTWSQNFTDGTFAADTKSSLRRVRAIRAF
jgi:hypothetical protein